MAEIRLQGLTKHFGDTVAVEELDLTIAEGEFMVLVGPSGCGKTTVLRMIAGLEVATAGEIWIGDRLVNDVEPSDRDLAMVFQNYALYPHMTVAQNISFGLRLRRMPRSEIDSRVREAVEMLGLSNLLARRPGELSGGQRQRVAVARALVRAPAAFLMDEPLSNLDAKLRLQTRTELIKLHRRLGVTTVYVTHDQTEAMTMGHRIAVLADGRLRQVDTPMGLYQRPADKFVAAFIGSPAMNFLPARLERSPGPLCARGDWGTLEVPAARASALEAFIDHDLWLGIRPPDLTPAPASSPPSTTFSARVDVVEPLGPESLVYLETGDTSLVMQLPGHSLLPPGQDLELTAHPDHLHFFDRATERRLG